MPLLDHFHPPLSPRRQWESFHANWAVTIKRTLNRRQLPPKYFAETQIHVGGRVEVDVATLEENPSSIGNGNSGGVAVETWAPPRTALVIPAVFPDEFEVQVFSTAGGGADLVAAIEFVSPANKDRPETRRAFAAKCASYLQSGVGLIIVDVVTDRHMNLHDELMELLRQTVMMQADLYTTAYGPSRKPTGDQIEIWLNPLELGQALPTMPLALRSGPTLPIDLETTYQEVCQDSRLP